MDTALESEEEEVFQAILDTMTDVVITTDAQGIVLQVNQAIEQQFGYRPAEITGKNVSLLMPEPHATEHNNYMARYLQTGMAGIIGKGRELSAKHKDGHLFPIHILVSKVEHYPFFVGVLRDISELIQLESEALLSSEMERNRISRELHDELGQNLMGLAMQLQGLSGEVSDTPLKQALQQLNHQLLQNVSNIRAIISELATVELEEQGLQDALSTFVNSCNNNYHTQVNLLCEGEWFNEDYSVAVQLYRIGREAIYNALKHAEATRIGVTLIQESNRIRLTVQDNGKGLPPAMKARDSRLIHQGHGLRNIHYRAHVTGAHLIISSSATTGTCIDCQYSPGTASSDIERTAR